MPELSTTTNPSPQGNQAGGVEIQKNIKKKSRYHTNLEERAKNVSPSRLNRIRESNTK